MSCPRLVSATSRNFASSPATSKGTSVRPTVTRLTFTPGQVTRTSGRAVGNAAVSRFQYASQSFSPRKVSSSSDFHA